MKKKKKSMIDKYVWNYLFAIVAISSIMFPSPIMIGPASAMILALGWIIVFGPIVMSPFNILSSHTKAPTAIFTLQKDSYISIL